MNVDRQAVVLVLDDDPNVGAFVRATLPETGYRVVWRPTAHEAIRAAGDEPPDVAVVDIGLSADGSGFDLLKHLRSQEKTESLPVVMLTGSADTLDRQKSLRLGADRYLVKPVRPETLRRVINEMLAARDDMWWTMTLRSDQVQRLRELFFDSTTDVPTLAIVVDDLRKLIESGERLQVFCLEIEPLFRVDERDHWESFDALRREFVRGLHVMIGPILGNDVVIATSHSGANDFYCFARGGRDAGDQTKLARDLERTARNTLKSIDADPAIADEVMVFAGAAVTEQSPLFAPRILYTAVREAKDNAERRETRYLHAIRERLARAVRERAITTVFQPVVDLRTRQVIGYEALSRGPAGSEVENPEVMFEMARDFDLVWELEALCIENVRPWLHDVCARGFRFFNLESQFIQQLQQRGTDPLIVKSRSCDAGEQLGRNRCPRKRDVDGQPAEFTLPCLDRSASRLLWRHNLDA